MPQLLFKGVSLEQIKTISKPLVEELAEICECGTDNFTLELIHSTFIFDGDEVPTYPFIEVKWFERGQEVRDKFAKTVTKYVLSSGVTEVEVAFTVFAENAYYIDGEVCG